MEAKGTAAVVLVEALGKVVLVKDPTKPEPHHWKLPGGKAQKVRRGDGGVVFPETPQQVAWRETSQETGITTDPERFKWILAEDRGDHMKHLFRLQVESLEGLKPRGNEGEFVAIFDRERLGTMDLFPPHRILLERAGIL